MTFKKPLFPTPPEFRLRHSWTQEKSIGQPEVNNIFVQQFWPFSIAVNITVLNNIRFDKAIPAISQLITRRTNSCSSSDVKCVGLPIFAVPPLCLRRSVSNGTPNTFDAWVKDISLRLTLFRANAIKFSSGMMEQMQKQTAGRNWNQCFWNRSPTCDHLFARTMTQTRWFHGSPDKPQNHITRLLRKSPLVHSPALSTFPLEAISNLWLLIRNTVLYRFIVDFEAKLSCKFCFLGLIVSKSQYERTKKWSKSPFLNG